MISAPSVCHIFPTFAPGGPELKRTEIINALGQRFRHTIMAIDGNYEAAARVERSAPVELVPAPRWEGRPDYALAMRAVLRRMAPDLVVTHAWGAIYALIGASLARVCPIVHAENGFGPDEALSLKWRRRLVRRLMLRMTYAVLVPSQTLERVALAEFLLPRSKVIRVPNGVNLRKFHPHRDLTWRRSYGIPDDVLLFGTVCRLRPEKNISFLLRAFARAELPYARLAIVGDGPMRARWEALASQFGVADRVTFTGVTDDPASCYAAFDVFVMSSITEQMPNALLEAMACGLPAICTNVGDSREMLGNAGPPAVVPCGDEDAYTWALTTTAGSGELRARLGAANRARCVEHYSLDRMVRQISEIYDAAIASTRRPRGTDPA